MISPRSTEFIRTKAVEYNVLMDLRTSVHLTDPTFYATGREQDNEAIRHEISQSPSYHGLMSEVDLSGLTISPSGQGL